MRFARRGLPATPADGARLWFMGGARVAPWACDATATTQRGVLPGAHRRARAPGAGHQVPRAALPDLRGVRAQGAERAARAELEELRRADAAEKQKANEL